MVGSDLIFRFVRIQLREVPRGECLKEKYSGAWDDSRQHFDETRRLREKTVWGGGDVRRVYKMPEADDPARNGCLHAGARRGCADWPGDLTAAPWRDYKSASGASCLSGVPPFA